MRGEVFAVRDGHRIALGWVDEIRIDGVSRPVTVDEPVQDLLDAASAYAADSGRGHRIVYSGRRLAQQRLERGRALLEAERAARCAPSARNYCRDFTESL